MPIVFVHGVATRDTSKDYSKWWDGLEIFLREKIAPVISSRPDRVGIRDAYWGDLGVKFAWNGASRPRSLLGQGAGGDEPSQMAQAIASASQPGAFEGGPTESSAQKPAIGKLPTKDQDGVVETKRPITRPSALTPAELSDLAATALLTVVNEPPLRAAAAIAADEISHDETARKLLAAQPGAESEIDLLQTMIQDRAVDVMKRQSGLTGMGASDWLGRFSESVLESLNRADSAPGYVLTKALGELRKPANNLVTLFIGDVFEYVNQRGTPKNPGPIPARVIEHLKAARVAPEAATEPMIVLSHSMGGQIVYDVVTAFLPHDPSGQDMRVDFWCATASQVGLFMEMKQFLGEYKEYGADKPNKLVPLPDKKYLGGWWNVWDPNDFISYTARGIFDGVDDEPYNSGMSLMHAHSGYLERPSFYNRFGEKLRIARDRDWS